MDFWPLYDEYFRPVRKFIVNMVHDEWAADDLVQETFLRAKENIGQLKDETKVKPWIFSIARNQCLDFFRRRKQELIDGVDLESEINLIPMASISQMVVEQKEMGRCVREKMEHLSRSQKEVLILFDVMGCSHQEIADILGQSVQNVKVTLHRARKAFKKILERECVFEVDDRQVRVCLPKPDILREDSADRI